MKLRLRDGTGEIDLKYLVEDADRFGNVRVYFRHRGRRKVRLRETPGTDAFMAEYRAAFAGEEPQTARPEPARPNTLRWLIERYYESAEFKNLGPTTRKVRRGILDRLCTARFRAEALSHGEKPFAVLLPKHVRRLRDEKADLPGSANARVKALRRVFGWAAEAGYAEGDPAKQVPYLRSATDGFHAWTTEEVRQFEARHPIGTKSRLALALLLYTGVRRSDVVRLGRQMETADGRLRFTETKGCGRHIKNREIPVLPELRRVIQATPSGHLAYLVTAFGKPFTANGFGNWFRKRCNEADLPHCSAHGLRKAGATVAANQGATEHQLMAIYGWESPKQAALYTRKANRRKLTDAAMHLIVPTESVPLSGPVRNGGTVGGKKS